MASTHISHDDDMPTEVLEDALGVELGGRIRRAREERGLSQGALGDAVGYKTSMVSALENGTRRLKIEDLAKLCVALDKEPEYFLRTEAIRAARPRPVGLTLRAQLVELHHQPLADAITSFLDDAESRSVPDSDIPDLHYLKPHGAARELLDRCGIHQPPVKLKDIARTLRVPIKTWDFPDSLSALIVEVDDDNYVIGVNQHHARNRQRFSLAHELGHAVLRHEAGYYLEFFDAALGEPPNFRYADEREANAFAAALLMDERWLRADWANGERSVANLARRYQVSEEAMSFRLMNIGLA
ncbi:MAG TPA: XRE family transcriptional regulator [Baekduia sp.]|uniref:helix-turn-helix domain-containing protein n=1 Tax=Baekduia sp. TaxID=2600305 RepID=UPI002CB89FCD|nr:XRE family transcriptional regulator [Baekduia sp.]HMJ35623.1 XRE family transcriptional regulator [Baekduia sp.]